MANNYGPKIVTDGLMLCLDAGNRKSYPGSGTVWSNLTGNGITGSLVNGPTFNSNYLGGVVLDGSNDYVSIPYTTNHTYFSFELTFSPNVLSAATVLFVGKYNGAGNDYWLGWNGSQSLLKFSTNSSELSAGPISVSNIYTATCVIGADAKRVYLNGILKNSSATVTCAPNGNIGLGTFGDYGSYYSAQTLYNYRFYNRALSESEVLQNYNATKGRFKL